MSNAEGACAAFPDTATELSGAQADRNDLPFTTLVLPGDCPRVTVIFLGRSQVERTYKLSVPAGHTLLARARGESSGVTLAFDFPTEPKPDRSNVARLVQDSLRVSEERQVSVRVRLVPKIRDEPQVSQVLLTVLVRP